MSKTIDITKLNDTELKAMAYELILENQRIDQNLTMVQKELNKRVTVTTIASDSKTESNS